MKYLNKERATTLADTLNVAYVTRVEMQSPNKYVVVVEGIKSP